MKKIFVVLLVFAMIVSLTACGAAATTTAAPAATTAAPAATSTAETAAASDVVLGISFGQNVHPFFKAMQKGAEDAAKEAGVELVVQSADSSLEKQVSQIEDLVSRGVSAILLNPYDSAGVATVVKSALDKNVGIFTMDIDVVGAKSTAFVASNNYKIGQMLGDYVIEKCGADAKIAILDGPSVTSLKDRADGFFDTIKGTNIEVVAEQGVAVERTKSLEAAETILQAHPDIDAFVGVNESSAMGILSACTAAGLSDILITGVDATNDIMTSIKDGTQLEIAVSQDPYQMGYTAVQQALAWIKGEKVEEYVEVPVEYINIDNVDEFIAREAQYAG